MAQFTKEFIYKGIDTVIQIPVHLPLRIDAEELVYIIMLNNDIPVFKDKEIIENLSKFTDEEENNFYAINTSKLIRDTLRRDSIENDDDNDIIKRWEKLIREETAEYGEKRCASDEELFATAYHKMVHSPALETMVHLEYMYAETVRQKTMEKDKLVQALADKQTDEMNKAVDRLEKDITESEINELVAKHYEDHALLIVKLTSEIDTIKEAQRREYREWLMQMLEQKETSSSLPTPKNSPLTPLEIFPITPSKRLSEELTPVLEESFTIHLGSQLKQMHNIRILSTNIMDLCGVYNDNEASSSEPTPQLSQTALGLYSNDLYGLLLMSDNKIGSRVTSDFQKVCRMSTDFHFANIDEQLDKISFTLQKHLKSDIAHRGRNLHSELLQMGDFYMTKHSNLSQVHVVFHIVSDESLRGNDINSRHAVVLGLRNILKIACSNDITSLTIPLLLQYEMTEEMTISWCEKRAELIFKCVKGFMIEMASWGGSELKNLQFMLPQGISAEVFHSLTEMLPRIFKVSNPKILK